MLRIERWICVEGITFKFHRMYCGVSFLLFLKFHYVMRILSLLCSASMKRMCMKRDVAESGDNSGRKEKTKICICTIVETARAKESEP